MSFKDSLKKFFCDDESSENSILPEELIKSLKNIDGTAALALARSESAVDYDDLKNKKSNPFKVSKVSSKTVSSSKKRVSAKDRDDERSL
ncbi:MAG: hypothetical protein ACLU33_01390 [Christensenellales bacterium]